MIRRFVYLFIFVYGGLLCWGRAQADSGPPGYGWFPFVLPAFDGAPTVTDVSWLNSAPAGRDGFITSQGEHFVDGNGDPVRFWGVNINFAGVFPDKKDAPKIAARLAKYGFNAVRLHDYEGYAAPNGLWVASAIGSSRVKIPRQIDPDQLDKMDYFVAQLIHDGIYVDLNLHVGRKVRRDEGFPEANRLPEKDKGVDYYDPQLIALQKDFASQLLEHKNPYTGRTYADEPGMCAVEVSNEDSLIGLWLNGKLNRMPPRATEELTGLWNHWLQKHYNEDSLKAAWHESSEPLDPVDLLALPLPPTVINPDAPDSRIQIGLANLHRFHFQDAAGAVATTDIDALGGPTVDGFVRPGMSLLLKDSGKEQWGFQLNRDGLDLREGQTYTLTFWARSSTARRISINLWQDHVPYEFEGFSGYADTGLDWQKYTFVFRPIDIDPEHSRLNFNFGKQLGTVQLGEVQLHAGGQLTVPDNWTLHDGVPLVDVQTTQVWRARRDFACFLGEIEQQYATDMRQYFKDDLKVQCPVWISQAQFGALGGLLRESTSDAVDVHAYWKHPIFSGGDWNGDSWSVGNVSMTTATGNDPLSAFAHLRLAGKPFVMTEWNSGQPSNYGAETLLMAAAYASWQDWAGVYLFDYHSNGNYDRDAINGFFSIDSNPAKMATAPAAALMFRRGDVAAARQQITLTLPPGDTWFNVANSSGPPAATPFLRLWSDAGAGDNVALHFKTSVQFGDVAFPTVSRAALSLPKDVFTSDTRQLRWVAASAGNPALFTVDSPSSKAIIGYGGTARISLGEWQVDPVENQYGVLALSAIDGQEIIDSKRLVLTALGDAQNPGEVWNATRDSVTNWGHGPTYVRGVSAQISLVSSQPKLEVWSLDATGARRSQVPAVYKNGVLTFAIGPQWQTAWYEITAAP